jgi:Rx N-terminal domain
MDTQDPEPTANIQERFFVNLKGAMDSLESFLHTSKKLAVYLGQGRPFNHTSKPVTIDEDELPKLKLKLEAIQAVLKRADVLGLSDEYDRLWMRELRDIEYRAEDVVETIQFEALRVTRFEKFKNELLLANAWKRKRDVYDLFPSPSGSLIRKITNITDRFVTLSC